MSQNPTPTRGIPLELGGKVYHLRFSLAAIKGLTAEHGEENFFKNLGVAKLGPVLLAGLKASAPDLTLEQLEDLIDLENLPYVTEQLGKAIGRSAKVAVPGEAGPAT